MKNDHRITLQSIYEGRAMKCVVHMCGNLTALFEEFEATGMDGIHSVTLKKTPQTIDHGVLQEPLGISNP